MSKTYKKYEPDIVILFYFCAKVDIFVHFCSETRLSTIPRSYKNRSLRFSFARYIAMKFVWTPTQTSNETKKDYRFELAAPDTILY